MVHYLDSDLIDYIKSHKELIENNNFQDFFNSCRLLDRSDIANFFMFDCKVDFLNYMTIIPTGLFALCSRLENLEIPKTVDTIESSAFQGCSNLKFVILYDSIKIIGDESFRDSGLEAITIPKSVYYLGRHAFRDCKNLKEIELSDRYKNDLKYLGIDENQTKVILY